MNSHLSPLAVLLIRWTALLALAWTAHALLRNCHPRWRLILWRSVLCFSVLMPFARLTIFKIPVRTALIRIDKPTMQSALATSAPTPQTSVSTAPSTAQPVPSSAGIKPLASAPPAVTHRRVPWLALAFSVWALGALWACGRLIRFQITLNRLRAQSQPVSEMLRKRARDIAAGLKVSRPFTVEVSHVTASPFAAGLIKPVVLLPAKLIDGLPEEESTVLLAHEIAHFQRRDLFWSIAWRWFQALCWPHPLIWAIPAAHNLACEEEADRAASGLLADAAQYSQLLARLALRILELPKLETALVLNAGSRIARRLDRLKKNPAKLWGWKHSTAGFTLVGALFLVTAACGFSSDEPLAADAQMQTEDDGATRMLTQASNELAVISTNPALAIEKMQTSASNQMALGFFYRGNSRAASGRFQGAAADFEQGLQINPSAGPMGEHFMWFFYTSLLIQNGDTAKYQTACKEMLRRFGDTTDGSVAEMVAKTCLWLPGALDPQDSALAAKLAEKSVTLTDEGDFKPWRRMAKALADYRQGRFQNAADTVDPLLKEMNDAEQAGTKTPSFDACHADVCFISAMTHHQLKEEDQARASLDQGREIVRTSMPDLESQDLGGDWMNILMSHALMSEADKSLGVVSPSFRPQTSQANTANKAPTDGVTPMTADDLAKMPASHKVGDLRVWQRIDDQTWHEVYPDGLASVFKVVGHTWIGHTHGTVLLKVIGHPGNVGNINTGKLQTFIPDTGSAIMHHWFRFSPGDVWHENPTPMSDVQADKTVGTLSQSQPQASQERTDNKTLTDNQTLPTADELSKMPHSYQFGGGNNLRVWKQIDEQTWHEVYPDGFTSVFKVVGRAKVGQTEGTVVAKVAGDPGRTGTPNDGTLQAFIPDKGSPVMDHLFRFSPIGQWHDLAPMRDVQ